MKYQDKRVLDLVQIKAHRKLLSIQNALIPDVQEELPVKQPAPPIDERSQLPPSMGENNLRLKAAVAIADLEELKTTLSEHRNAIAEELRQLRGYRAAVGAYRRPQSPTRGRH